MIWVILYSISSTVSERFIRGHTLYLFFCLGCSCSLILANGKSLIAGFGSCIEDLNLNIASPGLYPFFLFSIFPHLSRFSLISLFLQGQFSFSSENFLNFSGEHVHI